MDSLELPSLNAHKISHFNLRKEQSTRLLSKVHHFNSSMQPPSLKLSPTYGAQRSRRSVIQMQAGDEDFELKQMRDMAAAKKRWDALIREGKVKILTPREAGYAIQLSNKPLLDVRPSVERKKAWVKASTWIPIFEADDNFDAGTVARKVTNFVMGGWWSGMSTLSYDKQFLSKVEEKFPKDADLIVACQRGLSWTDQQRAAAAKEGWGYRLLFSARLVGIFLVADALFIGAQQVGCYIQDLRSH
ncbi:PREDICTED: rhodanese-like domain-containing protein 11, chloroplastic isoform X2 [Populus euphratica]|uniref:Rhodanese-like domain-containing protein 11, chloroplastic isoform X2 n=1 Tax=Populus euphratica TaxID=75702 RepID=A0AAJ6X505_POPEU|nr:PREDICTED: rhodanese-like domain-containing protein 11, chloroplastic isoform X2 [Populus euphratica]